MQQGDNELRKAIDARAKFAIGAPVALRTYVEIRGAGLVANPTADRFEKQNEIPAFIVVERSAVECHGGVQMSYTLSIPMQLATGDQKGHVLSKVNGILETEICDYAEAVAVMGKFANRAEK